MSTRSALEFSLGAAGPVLAAAEPDPLAWQARGDCQYSDPELWFPAKGESARPAKQICASCPVRTECLEFAIENPGLAHWGIWGGLSRRERSRLARSRQPKAAPLRCGKGLHLMTRANTGTDGRCRACRNASARTRDQERRAAARQEAQEVAA